MMYTSPKFDSEKAASSQIKYKTNGCCGSNLERRADLVGKTSSMTENLNKLFLYTNDVALYTTTRLKTKLCLLMTLT